MENVTPRPLDYAPPAARPRGCVADLAVTLVVLSLGLGALAAAGWLAWGVGPFGTMSVAATAVLALTGVLWTASGVVGLVRRHGVR